MRTSTRLQPQLFFLANQSLAAAFAKRGQWKNAGQCLEQILAHDILTVQVPGASQMWLRALASAEPVLQKAGETAKAAVWRARYDRLRSGSM